MNMTENSNLMVIAVLAVIASLAAAGFSYYATVNQSKITGYGTTSTGTTQLSVTSSVDINFSVASVNFGSGKVNTSALYAVLQTGTTVINGTWAGTQPALVLDNIGNVNVTINIKAASDNATFIGGTNASAQLNVTEKDVGACLTADRTTDYTLYREFNTTDPGTRFCNKLQYIAGKNRLQVDIKLQIPYNSLTGALSNTLTATATAN